MFHVIIAYHVFPGHYKHVSMGGKLGMNDRKHELTLLPNDKILDCSKLKAFADNKNKIS